MQLKSLVGAMSLMIMGACTVHRGEPISEPLRIDSAQVARGERAYMVHCNKCHPGGEKGLGVALKNKPLPGAMIKAQVRAGMGAMPSFPKELLPADQLEDLIAYIKVLRKQ
jgi:mono/diheme cytochrome c family protein